METKTIFKGWTKKTVWSLLAIAILLALLYLIALAATSYRVNNGTSAQIGEVGYCKIVINNSGHDIFVPTKTGTEYNYFITRAPAGVSFVNTQSDYSSACCWAGSSCTGGGWTTQADCQNHGGSPCNHNANGCWGNC